MLITSGDRISVESGRQEFTAFALESFDTKDNKDVQVRIIGEVGAPDEIGETVSINPSKSTINVAEEPQVEEEE